MDFAKNYNVHVSTGETPLFINGVRHPRTPVSFVRSPSLSGGGTLSLLGANAKEDQSCPCDPASLSVVTAPIGVNEDPRHILHVTLDDNVIPLSYSDDLRSPSWRSHRRAGL